LSIFTATRWDMRVLLSAVENLTSTIIEGQYRRCYGFWKDPLAFGKRRYSKGLPMKGLRF